MSALGVLDVEAEADVHATAAPTADSTPAPYNPLNAEEWLAHLPQEIRRVEALLEDARRELAHADAQVAQWQELFATPQVETSTKATWITPTLNHWRARVAELAGTVGTLERDCRNLLALHEWQTTP